MKSTCIALISMFCINLGAQDFEKTMTVSPGTSVRIESGTVFGADTLTLKSSSSKFAAVLTDVDALTSGAVVNYDRYVNIVGQSLVNGGNDLVALPVKNGAATFADFLTYSDDGGTNTNADYMVTSPTTLTLYAFGPFDTANYTYINYDSSADGAVELLRGKGYRAATASGRTLRFTGSITTNSVTTPIITGTYSRWNLIGNPYPTYLDSEAFLTANSGQLDPDALAIYGYNSGTNASSIGTIGNYTIINYNTNTDLNIAPGQGFYVANDPSASSNTVTFTPAMRLFNGGDDFIAGRDANNQMLRLKVAQANADFATEFYFNDNSTQALDPGYDAKLFGASSLGFSLYSHLVADNQGTAMAIQSLGSSDLSSVVIPLGLKAGEGQQITFSIENSTLASDVAVYLEDIVANTVTLLNNTDYSFTTNSAISGTGRFYLNIGNATLSQVDDELNNLNLYAAQKTIVVTGQLVEATEMTVYDTLGRKVMFSTLETGSNANEVDASQLTAGIYIVTLENATQELSKKVILK
ncbi:T9SS type A sorting domain-containing protein [Winogradskyella arenosi]|uniref:Putative secreted protein (Por secretion system target) n=1 Tax=Winogradskyella arenosi TaxID=533325 RepID=A0A368ZLC9_9FLAO|nr:T9SS type A sorting domain-containing protein [Winogradskyella arenosi]RCW93695.1 putative secreted protein (Por secretion system target) [Winogradskyella arenosi]